MTAVTCPSCDGAGQFVGVGAWSKCKRCLGQGFIEVV